MDQIYPKLLVSLPRIELRRKTFRADPEGILCEAVFLEDVGEVVVASTMKAVSMMRNLLPRLLIHRRLSIRPVKVQKCPHHRGPLWKGRLYPPVDRLSVLEILLKSRLLVRRVVLLSGPLR